MSLNTLHELMVEQLKDLYSAETQIVKALPKMIEASSAPALTEALRSHLTETEGQVARLEEIFRSLDESPSGEKCQGMEGLLKEAKHLLKEHSPPSVRDAGIIADAQRVEHYEIAAYGSAKAFAKLMGHDRIVALLDQTLEEEMAADRTLSAIAEGGVNEAALAAVGA